MNILDVQSLAGRIEPVYKSAANLFWDYAQEVNFGARMHDLRNKFAIDRLKGGQSTEGHIGHGSVKTTKRYYFRYLSQEQQAIANAGNVGL